MGTFSIKGSAAKNGANAVLVAIAREVAKTSPYNVIVFSGNRHNGGSSMHDRGQAIDVVLQNPQTGQMIPNLSSSVGFPIYESFAKQYRAAQKTIAPQLDSLLRWGGWFGPAGTGLNPGGVDLMHFDTKGSKLMVGGNWDVGTLPAQQKYVDGLGVGKVYTPDYMGPAKNEQYANLYTVGGIPVQVASLDKSAGVAAPQQVDPTIDHLARTMLAEARGEGNTGMLSVGFVAMNRANDNGKMWGDDVNDVLSQKSQFAAPIDRSKVTDAEYNNAVKLATQAYYRTVDDPTLGSTYFWNPKTANQAAVKGIAASEPFNKQIGNHVFYGKADLGPLITPTSNEFGRYLADLPGLSDEDRAKLVNPTVLADARRAAGDTDIPIPAGYTVVADKGVEGADKTPVLQFAGVNIPPALASMLPTGLFGGGQTQVPQATPVAQPAIPAAKAPVPAPAAPAAKPTYNIPKGRYGEDKIVQAILNNDPVALEAAKQNTLQIVQKHPLMAGMAIQSIQTYFHNVLANDPVLANAAKLAWTDNPALRQTLPPPVAKMADDAFSAVKPLAPPKPVTPAPIPVQPAVAAPAPIVSNVPIPRMRPLMPPAPALPRMTIPASAPIAPQMNFSRVSGTPSVPAPNVGRVGGQTVPSTTVPSPLAGIVASTVRAPPAPRPQTVVSNAPGPALMRSLPVTTTVRAPTSLRSQDSESTTANPGMSGDSTAPGTGLGGALALGGAGAANQQVQQKIQQVVQTIAPQAARGGNVQQAVQRIASQISPLISANGVGSRAGVTPGGQQYATRTNSDGGQTLSWYRSDSTADNPHIITVQMNANGEAVSTTGASGGSILCGYFYREGWLPRRVWAAESRWAVDNVPAYQLVGYYSWSAPILARMRRGGIGGWLLKRVMWVVVKAWAYEIAYVLGREPRGSWLGKLIRRTLEPYSARKGRAMYLEHGVVR